MHYTIYLWLYHSDHYMLIMFFIQLEWIIHEIEFIISSREYE